MAVAHLTVDHPATPTCGVRTPDASQTPITVWLVAVLAAVLYAAHDWFRYTDFRSAGYDLGIFDQAVRHYAHFDPPLSSIKGPDYNLLGDHWHPILALLAPLYWIWPDPRILGFALAGLLAASVSPVYAFTRRRFGHRAGIAAAVGYALWWPIQGIVDYDFHEIAFGVPLVALIIDAFDTARYRRVFVLSLILLLVREDTGLELIAIAVTLAGRRRIRLAALMAGLGAAGYYLATAVLIPAFASNGKWTYWDYPALGPTPASAVIHVVTHPRATLGLMTSNAEKRTLLTSLFAPLGFLSLGSPYLLLSLPVLAGRLLSDRATLWTTGYHYNAILAPILILAAVDTLGRIVARFTWAGVTASPIIGLFAGLTVVGTLTNPGLFPLQTTLVGADRHASQHIVAQRAVIARIPAGVCVDADDYLIPHLVAHDTVSTPFHAGPDATWLAIDLTHGSTGGGGAPSPAVALAAATAAGFAVVYQQDGMLLLHRDAANPRHCRVTN